MSLRDDIIDALYSYRFIPERIEGLQKERAAIMDVLMPRTGSSLVEVKGAGGGASDPTGMAAVNIAEHPSIKKLEALIAYWGQRQRLVDRLLGVLTDEELEIINFYYLKELPEDHADWPKVNKEKRRKIKKSIVKKAEKVWLSDGANGDEQGKARG